MGNLCELQYWVSCWGPSVLVSTKVMINSHRDGDAKDAHC